MDSKLPFFLFFMKGMMEGMIGMDYDRGLRMLKDLAERGHVPAETKVHGIQAIGPIQVFGIRKSSRFENMGDDISEAFAETDRLLERNGIGQGGERISVYHKFNCKGGVSFEYTAGRICEATTTPVPAGLSAWSMPEMQAFRVDHHGAYHHLGNAWSTASMHVRYKKLKQSKIGAFELYKNSPDGVAEEQLLTEVYLPLK